MAVLNEFLPIILFFLSYKWQGIYVATGVSIVAAALQLAVSRYQKGRFETLPLVMLAVITVLGSITLIFRNEAFIKYKPTVIYWLMGASLCLSQYFQKQPLLQKLAGKQLQLPPAIWQRLNILWGGFFIVMGALNLYIAQHYDTNTWVNFKLFGGLGLTLLFTLSQSFYLIKHMVPHE